MSNYGVNSPAIPCDPCAATEAGYKRAEEELKPRFKITARPEVSGMQGGAELYIYHDHHAEQILRGLVHSGYEVTIKELPR